MPRKHSTETLRVLEIGVIALLAIYAKADQANIPPGQRKELRNAIKYLYDWISRGG